MVSRKRRPAARSAPPAPQTSSGFLPHHVQTDSMHSVRAGKGTFRSGGTGTAAHHVRYPAAAVTAMAAGTKAFQGKFEKRLPRDVLAGGASRSWLLGSRVIGAMM